MRGPERAGSAYADRTVRRKGWVVSMISRLVGSLCLLLVVSWGLVAPGQASDVASSAGQPAAAKPKPKRWEAYRGAFFNNPHLAGPLQDRAAG